MKQFILVLFINYCIIFQRNNCKPSFALRSIIIIRKGSLLLELFILHSATEWVWGLGTSLPRVKEPTGLCWTLDLVWEYLFCFRQNESYFVLLTHECQWASDTSPGLAISDSTGMSWGPSMALVYRPTVLCHRARPVDHGEAKPSIETDLGLSLLCVRKVLFHVVLYYIVFLSVTPTPRH